MALIIKGVFHACYRPTGKVCYVLNDPSIVQLRGELEDDCMGAFQVLTEVDGMHHVVTAVADNGTLTAHPMCKPEEILEIPEVGTVLETPFGIYVDEMGVLRG